MGPLLKTLALEIAELVDRRITPLGNTGFILTPLKLQCLSIRTEPCLYTPLLTELMDPAQLMNVRMIKTTRSSR